MAKKITFLVLFLCIVVLSAWGQRIAEQVNSVDLKTVQLYKKGWELSQPVIALGSDDRLVLSFDEIGDASKNYNYTIVHCSSNWEVSNLMPSEFLQGFPHTPIDDYRFSMNTTFSYVHYEAEFPNEDLKILLSGNYIIKVYEEFNDQQPVMVKQFMVVEPLVVIDAGVKYPVDPMVRKTHQQLDLRILHPQLVINNPAQQIRMVVKQNGRDDNQVTDVNPDYIRPNELVYDQPRALLFESGHQYRWLDIRSTLFLSEQVHSVNFSAPYYHVELFPDAARSRNPFFYKEDSNGQFVVSVREYDDASIEADYLFVHFSLPVEQQFLDGHIYVLGGLNNNELTANNKMVYNDQTKAYELSLLLKQGFYNYLYAFVPYNGSSPSLSVIEGSFAEAENDYHIYVYFKSTSDYYERLVGYTVVNSKK